MAGHLKNHGGVQDVFSRQMHNPMFPVPLEAMQASLKFEDFEAGDSFSFAKGVDIQTAPLNHPPMGRLLIGSIMAVNLLFM